MRTSKIEKIYSHMNFDVVERYTHRLRFLSQAKGVTFSPRSAEAVPR